MTETSSILNGLTRGVQSTLLISDGSVIWVDPFQVGRAEPKADVLFITHAHDDHCSSQDMRKVLKDDTLVVGPPDCIRLAPVSDSQRRTVGPGENLTILGIDVEVVPAYNLDKPFHPRGNNWVGYIFVVNGRRLYHAGDTDRIPEMKGLRADVAFLPVGGTYTMDAAEAAAAASEDIRPAVAVPMHYGAVVGTEADALRFRELCGDLPVRILQPSL